MVKRDPERGIVLYMVLVVALLLLAAGAILASHLQRRTALFLDQQRNLHAQVLLDTGMATALGRISENFQYQNVETIELDGGSVQAEVRFTSVSGRREVRLTSSFRGERRRAVAVVEAVKGVPPRVVSWRPMAVWESSPDGGASGKL